MRPADVDGESEAGQGGGRVIDREALARLERIGGGRLVQRMIALYLENAAARVDALGEAVRSGVLDDARRAAHSLKSTSANVGAERVQALAARIEAAAAGGDAAAASIAPLAEALDAAFVEASNQLRSLREEPS